MATLGSSKLHRYAISVFAIFTFLLAFGTLYGSYREPQKSGTALPSSADNDHLLKNIDEDAWTLHPENHIYRKAETIHLQWNVTLETRAPDGVSRPVLLINGESI